MGAKVMVKIGCSLTFGTIAYHYPECPFFIPYMDYSEYTHQGTCNHPMRDQYAGDTDRCESLNYNGQCPMDRMRDRQITEEEKDKIDDKIIRIKKIADKYNRNKTQVKFEYTGETKKYRNHVLHRIRAVEDFGNVTTGEVGGWIEYDKNLSRKDSGWVADNAMVFGNGTVTHDVYVCGNAMVFGNASLYGRAFVGGNAKVYDDAYIKDLVVVDGNAKVHGNVSLHDSVHVGGTANLLHRIIIYGDCEILEGELRGYRYTDTWNDSDVYHHIIVRERENATRKRAEKEAESNYAYQTNLLKLGRFGSLDLSSEIKTQTKPVTAASRFSDIDY
jgi:carbonic anhydrase/acetyltransferase-like protein (isoleucine patch superfamily)